MSDHEFESYNERFDPEQLDEAEIIDDPPKADPRDELQRLQLAAPKKDWFESKRYQDVEEALTKANGTTDEANNLGCAQAWLAVTKKREDYWRKALDSLERSKTLDNADLERATFNIARVKAAREAAK